MKCTLCTFDLILLILRSVIIIFNYVIVNFNPLNVNILSIKYILFNDWFSSSFLSYIKTIHDFPAPYIARLKKKQNVFSYFCVIYNGYKIFL